MIFLSAGVQRIPSRGVFWFTVAGMTGGLAGRYLSLVPINRVGLARAPILTQTRLVWSAAMAVVILGGLLSVAGAFAIVSGG